MVCGVRARKRKRAREREREGGGSARGLEEGALDARSREFRKLDPTVLIALFLSLPREDDASHDG